MSDEPQRWSLKFTEADTPVHKTVIGAFLDIYNAYYHATRITNLDAILAQMILAARSLQQIGEVDESYCEALETMIREFCEKATEVGRYAAGALHHMNERRGGAPAVEKIAEEWPDLASDNEQ